MALAFKAASRGLTGLRTIGKAVEWPNEDNNCQQRYGDVNATSHLVLKCIKPQKGGTLLLNHSHDGSACQSIEIIPLPLDAAGVEKTQKKDTVFGIHEGDR